jgi:hypothetical protein
VVLKLFLTKARHKEAQVIALTSFQDGEMVQDAGSTETRRLI